MKINTEEAISIINSNFHCQAGSLRHYMYEEATFNTDAYWQLYDAITALSKREFDISQEREITYGVCWCYSQVLFEFMCHFNPDDIVNILGFPENYYDYIERLELAFKAFFTGENIEDREFDLQRPS